MESLILTEQERDTLICLVCEELKEVRSETHKAIIRNILTKLEQE